MPGKIILLNGPSSAGKSTLARALQERLPLPYWHYSIDHLAAAGVLPQSRIDSGEFPWRDLRPAFFEGFHGSVAAFAAAGNNLIVEHIIETEAWLHRLLMTLDGFDVFFVGLHCPLDELERRALGRGGRKLDEARADAAITHTFGSHDFTCVSTDAPESLAAQVVEAWAARAKPGAFAAMRENLRRDAGAGCLFVGNKEA